MNTDTNAAKAEKRTYDGGVTNETVNNWKAQHRKVTRIDVEDEGDLHVGYFKRPSMETMAAVNKLAKSDEMKSAQTLFDGAARGGGEFMLEDIAPGEMGETLLGASRRARGPYASHLLGRSAVF